MEPCQQPWHVLDPRAVGCLLCFAAGEPELLTECEKVGTPHCVNRPAPVAEAKEDDTAKVVITGWSDGLGLMQGSALRAGTGCSNDCKWRAQPSLAKGRRSKTREYLDDKLEAFR